MAFSPNHHPAPRPASPSPGFSDGSYHGKRVLVTGHTGFKGSWLALWLHRLGAEVHGYALPPPTTPSHFAACRLAELLATHTVSDIRDAAAVERSVRELRPDVIFHLAAQPLVRASYSDPRGTFEVNVMGTANLLEAVRRAGKPCAVVVVTSDKCYEDQGRLPGCREDDPMGGHDPYSASKGCAELVAASYRRSFFPPARLAEHEVRLATARAGNVIGGGDWAADRIIPDAVRHLLEAWPAPVRDPHAVRPWQHVLEPLAGYLALGRRLMGSDAAAFCTAWNFGPAAGADATVRELVERFCADWGGGRWEDLSAAGAPHETAVLRLCSDKAARDLGWRPRWDLAETIRRTAAWYYRYYQAPAASLRETSLNDIIAYSGHTFP